MKFKFKIGIDLLMTVLLLLLMAYQVTGAVLHEWIGAGMLALFFLHNFLNIRWYGGVAKGKYASVRIMRTVVNFAVLAAMLAQAYSGVILSRHVFSFLPIRGGMATARVMHLAGAYWSFVLMCVHLGLHWGIIMGLFRKISAGKQSAVLIWLLRLLATGIAVYGAVCFHQANIAAYLFLRVEFAFLDYEKSAMLILAEYLSMMCFWALMAYYVSKALGKLSTARKLSGK